MLDRQVLAVVDAMPVAAAVVSDAGTLLHANARLRALGPFDLPALLGRLAGGQAVRLEAAAPVMVAAGRLGEHHLLTFSALTTADRPDTADPAANAAAGNGQTPGDIETEYRQQYEILAELSNTILGSAEHFRQDAQALAAKVSQRTRELHEANMDAIYMLAIASEAKDDDTGRHVSRIGKLSGALARRIGLSAEQAEEIAYSAILHDVGKIHVPDAILKKPGKLNAEERAVVEQHTVWGERILADRPFFRLARVIARSHHENFDASGYPDGTAGEAIPLAARIVHVVDVFDALTNCRAYKAAWPLDRAIVEMHANRGIMFDPALIDVFEKMLSEVEPGSFDEDLPAE